MKKKLGVLFLVALCTIAMAACGSSKTSDETKTISTVEDLEGAKIGVQLVTTGDIYSSDYEGDEAGTTVERYNKMADAIQALKQGKIDCVIVDEQPAIAVTKDSGDLKILDEEFVSEDYAICIAKGNEQLKEKINEALGALKEDGTIADIISNYIGEEAGKHPYETPAGTSYDNGTLVAATNATFPPYEYYENETVTGIDIDIITAIGDRLGMKVEISDMEFDAIINSVNSGKADVGIAGLTVTEDRLKSIDFSDAYTTSRQVIIIKGDGTGSQLSLSEKFKNNFIKDSRWKYIAKGLENTFKNFIFGVITSGFYKYAVAHEGGFLADDQYETVLVIEEANEVLIGTDTSKGDNVSLSGESEFEQILDQSAGYGLFVFAITQKIADMPSSIIANAGIVFAGKLKRPEDISVVVRAVGREERIDDRDLVKWFPRSPIGYFVCQTSRSFDFKDAEPVLVQISRLNINPPSNLELDEIILQKEIKQHLKEIA